MSTNNKPLTKEERNHLAHHYWEDLNHWQGPANTWNCENGIFDYDLFPFIRAWLLETRNIHRYEAQGTVGTTREGWRGIQSEKRDFGGWILGWHSSRLVSPGKDDRGGVASSTKASAKGSV